MNSILSLFTPENFEKINIPALLKTEILSTIRKLKLSGKKTKEKICKTDLYNHSHYNTLFLVLNKKNLAQLSNKKKDIDLHKICFDIDLSQTISQEEL